MSPENHIADAAAPDRPDKAFSADPETTESR